MSEQNITLSLSLVNGTLQYLGTRPYGEVFQLVQAIQAAAIPQLPIEEKPADAVEGAAS